MICTGQNLDFVWFVFNKTDTSCFINWHSMQCVLNFFFIIIICRSCWQMLQPGEDIITPASKRNICWWPLLWSFRQRSLKGSGLIKALLPTSLALIPFTSLSFTAFVAVALRSVTLLAVTSFPGEFWTTSKHNVVSVSSRWPPELFQCVRTPTHHQHYSTVTPPLMILSCSRNGVDYTG